MKVWARNPTRGADFADDLPFFQLLPQYNIDIAQVRKHGYQPLAMINVHQFSAEKEIAQLDYFSGTWSDYRGTFFSRKIHPAMWTSGLPVEYSSAPEASSVYTLDR
jgi:hypothetical protein